jgi:hypothetical protein
MSIFKRFLELVTGRRIRRPVISVSSKEPLSSDEIGFFARWLKRSMYADVETYGGGKKLTGIMTRDIDPLTGKLYPDYLERRKRRKETAGPVYAGTVDHDISPD